MRKLGRLLLLVLLLLLSLQLYFAARVLLMRWVDPASTTFQRAEMRRIVARDGSGAQWSQHWVALQAIHPHLPRAVIASEDAGFAEHDGIEWEAVEQAWRKNERAEARAARRGREPKVVGGSTITQQLAKNLFLSGERTLARKAQEAGLSLLLDALLSKERLMEIYLNHVEWGEGVFGAQAASRHYFRVDAARLSAWQAARLAVMLPAPKRFEKLPGSPYLGQRSATIVARMGEVRLPW